MTETELLQDCLQRLNACGLPYFLTGSMASNYWGIPRTTHDLDFVLQLHANDVSALVSAFQSDFFIQEMSVRSALQPPSQFNALDNRSALKVDFWILSDEPFQQEMFGRRTAVTLFGIPAWIASAEDVLLHKLFWHSITPSNRQLLDAAGVWAMQEPHLDRGYLTKWAPVLKVQDDLGRIERGEFRPKST